MYSRLTYSPRPHSCPRSSASALSEDIPHRVRLATWRQVNTSLSCFMCDGMGFVHWTSFPPWLPWWARRFVVHATLPVSHCSHVFSRTSNLVPPRTLFNPSTRALMGRRLWVWRIYRCSGDTLRQTSPRMVPASPTAVLCLGWWMMCRSSSPPLPFTRFTPPSTYWHEVLVFWTLVTCGTSPHVHSGVMRLPHRSHPQWTLHNTPVMMKSYAVSLLPPL